MVASLLAEALYQQNRLDEAMPMADRAGELAPADDVEPHARCRAVNAKILARRGRLNAARHPADHAVTLVEPTNKAGLLAEVLVTRADVARIAGTPAKAAADLRRALQIYQQKGAQPLADRARAMIAEISPAADDT